MLNRFKIALAEAMPPEALHWVRSVKRAVMAQPPLTSAGARETSKNPEPQQTNESDAPQTPKILQELALEKYAANLIWAPYLFYDADEVLVMPVRELAKALTLSVSYINSSHVNGDIAEFGTMGGFTARTIAMSMVFDPKRQPLSPGSHGDNPFRKLRLFDSFEGLPEITSEIDWLRLTLNRDLGRKVDAKFCLQENSRRWWRK